MLVTDRPSATNQEWLKRREAATRYGVSTATIDRWIRNEGLPASKIGANLLINVYDIETFVRARRARRQRMEDDLE